ncbi:hypothetical protein SAMN02745118_00613 [Selenihalanaerobacter shriftii]|uniref:CdaR GGDEF-like domain-containing protein n=1 Tax=Selenihalanaerobacter shriftii TaxID=142842 RepID=A0A1T4K517_9FIRM|nr:hypothetical protein SAMN02745118_00613 [Selenihalanaerobacter shriftii]
MDKLDELILLQRKYQNVLLNDGGIRTLCNTLIEQINNPVFILDRYRKGVLYVDRDLSKEWDFYTYLEEKELKEQEDSFTRHGLQFERRVHHWQDQKNTEVQVKLKQEDEVLGFLIILEKDPLKKSDYLAIMQGAYALALKLHQNALIQNLAQRCSNELIDDFLNGRFKEKDELVERGELAGWDLTIPYQLFVLQIDFQRRNKKDQQSGSFYFYEMKERIMHDLNRIINNSISRESIVFAYDDDIILLVNYSHQTEEIK